MCIFPKFQKLELIITSVPKMIFFSRKKHEYANKELLVTR